jgi:O-antigen/teichoic acid export membrane protein
MAQDLSEIAETLSPAPRRGDEEYFRTDRLKADLGARAARGGLVTVTTQGFKFAAGLAATVVLARLLTPADYGLVGMVAVVTGFVGLFKDLGLSAATVQREEIGDAQVSTLFWVNVGVSLLVGVVTVALAPAVAWFYGEPRLAPVTLAYSVGFLFGGLTVQHEALLKRQMRFAVLAAAEVAALLASIVTTVVLAWRGFGYWSLVMGHLALSFVYMVAVWVVCGWRPGRARRGAGVRQLLGFGGNLTGFVVINYFARNLDNMLIGRFWGGFQLGLYAKAYQLLLLPLDQISYPLTNVAVPTLSRLNGEPERYRRAYLRILEKVAVVTMPGIALLVVTADWVVLIVLGPQWVEAGRIFALLGVAAMLQPVANTMGWLFITQGRTREMLRWAPIGSGLIVAAIVAGLPWGAAGVATAYSVVWVLLLAPLLFWYVGRRGHVRTRDIYAAMAPSLFASLGAMAAVAAYRRWASPSGPVEGLAVSCLIAATVTLALLLLLPAGRRVLRDAWGTAALLSGRAGGA